MSFDQWIALFGTLGVWSTIICTVFITLSTRRHTADILAELQRQLDKR